MRTEQTFENHRVSVALKTVGGMLVLTFTRAMFALLGLSAVAIGLMIFGAGPHATAEIFGSIVALVSGNAGYAGGLDHANVDTEMRFYSVFWIAYGCILLWLVPKLVQRRALGFSALGLFFAGGVGRVISYVSYGSPDLLFVVLMLIEIVGPVIVALTFAISLRAKTFM